MKLVRVVVELGVGGANSSSESGDDNDKVVAIVGVVEIMVMVIVVVVVVMSAVIFVGDRFNESSVRVGTNISWLPSTTTKKGGGSL